MKNFFKKLAFVLALAMVLVSVAPATANAATKAPSLKKTSKILYIGGDLTGTIPSKFRFYFNNAAGYTATWKSENTKVATVNKNKEVVAVGVGETTVVATLKNKAGNEVVCKAKVYVRQNAQEVGFGSMTAVESPLTVGQTAKINVYRLVGEKKIWTQNDMATCTDKIVWKSSDVKVATVDKFGTVTAVAPGEAKITATATQAQGPTAGESASYNVTVVEAFKAEATKVNTLKLTFGTAVESLDAANVVVKNTSDDVRTYAKSVTLSEDKKTATVEFYNNFTNGKTYAIAATTGGKTYNTDLAFKSGAVKSIVAENQVIVAGVASNIKYTVYDEFGLDVTAGTVVTFSDNLGVNQNGKLTLSDGVIAYVTITYVNPTTAELIRSAQFTVTGRTSVIANITNTTLSTKTTGTDVSFTTPVLTIAKGAQNTYLWSQTVDQYNTKVAVKGEYNPLIKVTYENLSPEIFVVSSNGLVNTVAQGTGYVRINIGDKSTTIAITVTAELKATTIKTTVTNGSLTVTTPAALNLPSVKVEVLDQYGNVLKSANGVVGVSVLSGTNLGAVSNVTLLNGEATINLNPTAAGTGILKVEFDTLQYTLATVAVAASDRVAVGYKITGVKDLDLAKLYANTQSAANIELYSVNAGGFYIENATDRVAAANITFKITDATGATVKTVTGASMTIDQTTVKDTPGVYTVSAITNNEVVNVAQFKVTDSATKPAVSINVNSKVSTLITNQAIEDCLTLPTGYHVTGVKFLSSNALVPNLTTFGSVNATITTNTILFNVSVQITDTTNTTTTQRTYTYENLGHITFNIQ
ncbi:Ig-like domain-containing protein [Lachnoclostridium phytofermentans]|uniref:Ig domain protein group 2 domain protein n=1 Tax=Lachnoclostridium phytofermentans (strain ATCC 700394 / DSM 18823 / ISDg) TaxID=357809 RepID=A9KI12_LACP7|nr:Ig-like domain-containing protein [Lachnoclostridium phytofermentans]ABX43859.1 Ig domain protein group 2 domain protein [Lachnoclostridium phytofermentans ISDg]